jgi:hypothetical protein
MQDFEEHLEELTHGWRQADRKLKALYSNRALYTFIHGEEWFESKVAALFLERFADCKLSGSGIDKDTLDYMNSLQFNRSCWELDNDFYIERE